MNLRATGNYEICDVGLKSDLIFTLFHIVNLTIS